ncbi:MAG TPA: DUF6790 family protein [Bauldia sp.]|nr:DUF6790 family protein [Bauldia sp.]
MPPPDFTAYFQLARDHLPLTMLLAGLAWSLIVLAALPKPHSGRRIVGVLFGGYLFFTIGLLFLAKAVAAGAFGPEATAWLSVPSATTAPEAAYGCLAFAVIAFLALARNLGLRAAAVIGPAIYMMAPLLAAEPTIDALEAHAVELTIALIGAVLLLLQASVDRPVLPAAHSAAPAGGPGM